MSIRTLAWLVLFAIVTSLALRVQSLLHVHEVDTLYREQATYQRLRDLIRDRYVTEVDERKMFYGAMEGMVAGLDPHSHFFPPDENEQFQTSTSGQLEGVGIEIEFDETRGLTVVTPLQGTPAFRGGILPGDRIVKIDGEPTDKLKADEARHKIKGKPGTVVRLTVLHEGSQEPVEIELTRAVIEIKSVQIAEILGKEWVAEGGPAIGYVQVEQFQQKTAEDLEEALLKLEKEGMKALILDLRMNPGGLLRSAEEVSDMFLEDGLIVSVVGRSNDERSPKEDHYAKKSDTHPNYPIAVLVDSRSASASEVVAGALKDRGRAVLVGDKTYGKFSVQEVIPVPLGKWGEASLKLTTAKYKTPTGPCIDGQGIVPDYLVPSTVEQQRALKMDRSRRHLRDNNPNGNAPAKPAGAPKPAADPKPEPGGAKPEEPGKAPEPFVDEQLKKAIEVMLQQLKSPPAKPGPDTEGLPSARN